MIDPEKRILLVLNKDSELDDVRAMLVRVGLTHFAGYLAGGMTAWSKAGYAMQPLPQITVEELNERRRDMQIIDVRKDDEWNEGHIPGAQHTFVPDLPDQFDRYDRERPTVTYCASGYRSNIAASLLQRHGFRSVHSVPGSFMAWTSAGLPVAQNGKS
jgi:hydroxyacylglutathione hydrolase